RYLRPKRTFVSIITLISIIGVALGVAVLIIVISVMSGFHEQLRDTILRISPHLRVFEPGSTVTNYPAVMSLLESNKQVKGVSPYVIGPVLLEIPSPSGQSAWWAPMIHGVDPQTETNVSILPSSIVEGKFDLNRRGLLIGTAFANRMDLHVGD